MMVQYSKAEPMETVMTFSEWERIHNIRKLRRRAERAYYLKQKFSGMAITAVGIITPLAFGNATISIFTLPLGMFLILTNKKVMMF